MPSFAARWYRQAQEDLRAAEASAASGHHEWACFQSQQAAEKALKAYLYSRGRTALTTHALIRLVRICEELENDFSALYGDAKFLDTHYIPTRYPNGLADDVIPAEFYDAGDSEKCLQSARSILNACRPSAKS